MKMSWKYIIVIDAVSFVVGTIVIVNIITTILKVI